MTTLTNSYEGGTNGTTITTGNSGGGSGNAFDTVTTVTSGTNAYDNTHAAHGSLAAKLATGANSGQALDRWDSSMGTQTQVWFRSYLYFTANPSTTQVRVVQGVTGGGSLAAGISVSTAGKLVLQNAAGSTVATSTNAIPTNAWFRIEGFFISSTTVGQIELKLFTSMDSTTATETLTTSANLNTQTSMGIYQFGIGNGQANAAAFWQDDIGLSSTGYIGPAVTSTNTAGLLPVF